MTDAHTATIRVRSGDPASLAFGTWDELRVWLDEDRRRWVRKVTLSPAQYALLLQSIPAESVGGIGEAQRELAQIRHPSDREGFVVERSIRLCEGDAIVDVGPPGDP